MNEEITAEWARAQSEKVLGAKVQAQLNECFNSIKNAVSQNKTSTYVGIYIESLTENELIKRGFKIDKISDQRDGDSTCISW